MTDKNSISNKLLEVAGQELTDDLRTQVICKLMKLINSLLYLTACRTGDAKITTAYNLPARLVNSTLFLILSCDSHVIHTVGPRYNIKYKTAAESALYNCYRSVLQLTK